MDRELVSIVIPVFEEGENIVECLGGLARALSGVPHEILICYDQEGDSTLAAIRGMDSPPENLRLVKNDLGPGPGFAMRAGFAAAGGDVVVSFMADLCDPPEVVVKMAKKVRAGAAVVGGVRGPEDLGTGLKGGLKRLAGFALEKAGFFAADPTNNFRAYDAGFLARARPLARGFDLALELTVKAWSQGLSVEGVASSYSERSRGESSFRLSRDFAGYLRWFSLALARALAARPRAPLP
ncbi:MAG: glycosyltransferase family 2 protein [Proteobacteria bacterium]|nr:glycosyltransferase family 2 protein [Pseudomonadota bacterium]